MKVLHVTPSTDGYEEVILLANRISKTNGLALIEKNGKKFITGGFLITDTPEIRNVMNSIPKENLYQFLTDFRMTPFVLMYATEEMLKDETT